MSGNKSFQKNVKQPTNYSKVVFCMVVALWSAQGGGKGNGVLCYTGMRSCV